MSRDFYLHDIPLDQAIAAWREALAAEKLLGPLPAETIPLEKANGRTTAAPVWARLSSPHYHAAAMDGYAVRAADTRGATETSPKTLVIGREALPVDTGDPLPPNTDAVIMIEDTQPVTAAGGQAAIEILGATPPWRYVRPLGEDIVATELVLPANHVIRPADVGALAGSGHAAVAVFRRPRVAIQPTGSELVPPGETPAPGAIIEFNSLVLAALAEEDGAIVTRLPAVADDYQIIKTAVAEALPHHDLIIINAGSSAGSEDYTASIVADLGQVQVHGIAIRPGHPVVLGTAPGKALAGLPGYPVSAVMTYELLVRPLLNEWQGRPPAPEPEADAFLARKIFSPSGEDEFVRVTLGRVGDKLVATPLNRGAGVIMSLVRADALVKIPRFSEGFDPGAVVPVQLLRSRSRIENTIIVTGSHDLTLGILADHLRRRHPEITLSSAHVGSLGGLMALQRGEAHLAGSHLLDEDSGDYNRSFIDNLLTQKGIEVALIGFVRRQQGLIVPPGNPRNIRSLTDLTRPDVSYINRQRGAGTRVLLDHALKQHAINPSDINGYGRQEYTHLAVAAAVQSGTADAGLGILGAARALDLDFVPLFDERYDLIIPTTHLENPLIGRLLDLIRQPDSSFRNAVTALGGYDVSPMGQVFPLS